MAKITRSEFLALSEREKRIFLRSGTVTVDPPQERKPVVLENGAILRSTFNKLSLREQREHVKSGKAVVHG
jgi:hypothetical protein